MDEEGDFSTPPKCDNMTDFIRQLKLLLSSRELVNETFYIVLDKAERLRDIEANALPAFLRLQELSQLNICVILLSQIVWEKFQVGTGFYEPITIHFTDYSKVELLQIMAKDCPPSYPVEFYTAYCQLLMSVFYSVCRDLNELRHLVNSISVQLFILLIVRVLKLIPIPPMDGFWFETLPPLWKFSLPWSSYFLSKILAFETPTPLEFLMNIIGVGLDIFWNCTFVEWYFLFKNCWAIFG